MTARPASQRSRLNTYDPADGVEYQHIPLDLRNTTTGWVSLDDLTDRSLRDVRDRPLPPVPLINLTRLTK